MHVWQAVVLGLVEGITEYLPVSSTGHLIIASELMGLTEPGSRAAVDAFNIVIQGGAILAVLGLYWPRFVQMLKGVLGRDNAGLLLLINLVIAFMPAAVLGLLLHELIARYLFNAKMVVLALALGGLYMIALDVRRLTPARFAGPGGGGKSVTELTPGGALMIGLMQCVALWPGVSRSMMTITGGLTVGLRPAAAAEFSFLLGMPTLLAATGYALYKDLSRAEKTGTPNLFETLGWLPVIAGVLVATVSAIVAVRWLVTFLNRRGLTPFGIYRIALAIVLASLVLTGLVNVTK